MNRENNTITAVNTQGNIKTEIELYAQNFFINMIEVDSKEYLATSDKIIQRKENWQNLF